MPIIPITIPARGSFAGASFEDTLAAATPLMNDGWTPESAMSHLQGSCDRMVCCGWDE